jgi:hypothetical protein
MVPKIKFCMIHFERKYNGQMRLHHEDFFFAILKPSVKDKKLTQSHL